jgi:DNA invertase Pin-like site-specific DNA recombinase
MPGSFKTMRYNSELPWPRNGDCYRVVGYMRIPDNGGAPNHHSFDLQEKSIIAKLDEIYGPGHYEVEMYHDLGSSREDISAEVESMGLFTPGCCTRPGLKLVSEALEHGEVDALAVYSLHRLFRDLDAVVELQEGVLRRREIHLIETTGGADFMGGEVAW